MGIKDAAKRVWTGEKLCESCHKKPATTRAEGMNLCKLCGRTIRKAGGKRT